MILLGKETPISLLIVTAVGWSSSSVAMALANKKAVMGTRAPLALTSLQMIVSTLLALASCNLHFGEGTLLWSAIVPPFFVLMCVA